MRQNGAIDKCQFHQIFSYLSKQCLADVLLSKGVHGDISEAGQIFFQQIVTWPAMLTRRWDKGTISCPRCLLQLRMYRFKSKVEINFR